jgi:hypothetical protein
VCLSKAEGGEGKLAPKAETVFVHASIFLLQLKLKGLLRTATLVAVARRPASTRRHPSVWSDSLNPRGEGGRWGSL